MVPSYRHIRYYTFINYILHVIYKHKCVYDIVIMNVYLIKRATNSASKILLLHLLKDQRT